MTPTELDALCAEKVLEWPSFYDQAGARIWNPTGGHFGTLGPKQRWSTLDGLPMDVVRAMAERGYLIKLEHLGSTWEVQFWYGFKPCELVESTCLGHTTVLAALRALEEDV